MPEAYVLGIDMGTSGAKVGLVDARGVLVRLASEPYRLSSPHPGLAEQDADDWWRAVQDGVRRVVAGLEPEAVAAIGFSNAGGSFVVLDRDGRPVRPAMAWMDRRSSEEFEAIALSRSPQFWRERLGVARLSFRPVGKLVWLREHEPEAFRRIRWVLQGADYAIFRMAARAVTDHSNACALGLYNLRARAWDPEVLRVVDLDGRILPELGDPGTVAGHLLEGVAKDLGLRPGTPLVLGAWDQACAVVGAGSVSGTDALLSTGTAWVMSHPMPELPGELPRFGIPCWHALPGEYLFMLAMSNGGSVVEWYRQTFASAEGEGEVGPEANGRLSGLPAGVEEVPPGAGGVLFLPHLIGAAAPHADPAYSGCLLGLRHGTSRAQIFRAILEAVAYETRWSVEALSEIGRAASRLRMIGGATRSAIWPQIVAGVTGLEVLIPEQTECALLGAARLARSAAGIGGGEAGAVDRIARRLQPDPGAVAAYGRAYRIYQQAHDALRQPLAGLHALGGGQGVAGGNPA